jgi:2-C-methyl-D-erythritol 4-phosphate cytidylyltransferase
MKSAGIILGGGTGSRFSSDLPKQFVKLNEKPVINHSIEIFIEAVNIVVAVIHPNWIDYAREILPPVCIVAGGNSRQESVYNGLCALKDKDIKTVAIHDSARPFMSKQLLLNAIKTAEKYKCAVPVISINDTLAVLENGVIVRYEDRSRIFAVQTPQAFDFKAIREAHTKAQKENRFDFTDDSSLFKEYGGKVYCIDGEQQNIKITYTTDI